MMLVACLPLLDRCGPNFMTRPTPFTAHPKFTSPSRLCNTLFADLCNSSRNPPRFGGSAAFLFTPFEISIEASTFRISGEATTSGTFGCKPKSCCNWPLNWRCGTPKAFEATGGSHKMCISAEPWPKKTKRKQKWEGKKHPKKTPVKKPQVVLLLGPTARNKRSWVIYLLGWLLFWEEINMARRVT